MNAMVQIGYGDAATWAGRSPDGDAAYEAWRENTPILAAIGEEEAGQILELLWGGGKDDAATRLAAAYGNAWEEQKRKMANGSALARVYRCGRVPVGYDD